MKQAFKHTAACREGAVVMPGLVGKFFKLNQRIRRHNSLIPCLEHIAVIARITGYYDPFRVQAIRLLQENYSLALS